MRDVNQTAYHMMFAKLNFSLDRQDEKTADLNRPQFAFFLLFLSILAVVFLAVNYVSIESDV